MQLVLDAITLTHIFAGLITRVYHVCSGFLTRVQWDDPLIANLNPVLHAAGLFVRCYFNHNVE